MESLNTTSATPATEPIVGSADGTTGQPPALSKKGRKSPKTPNVNDGVDQGDSSEFDPFRSLPRPVRGPTQGDSDGDSADSSSSSATQNSSIDSSSASPSEN